MRAFVAAVFLFVCTIGHAEGPSTGCGDAARIKKAMDWLADDYGDVGPSLQCTKPKSKAEALICADKHLSLMYKLDAMAQVYAVENATKRPVDHKARRYTIPVCETRTCLCAAFTRSTNDSLGGESPYYVDEDKK